MQACRNKFHINVIFFNMGQQLRRFSLKIFLFLVLPAILFAEQIRLGNFGRQPSKEQLCEIILSLGQWFRKRCCL